MPKQMPKIKKSKDDMEKISDAIAAVRARQAASSKGTPSAIGKKAGSAIGATAGRGVGKISKPKGKKKY